jgi:hypothetical protein
MANKALIQESWIYGGKINGLTSAEGTIFSVVPKGNP